jgi:ABC-type transporter Mla maintaining outer membrane lipid asymmetry ATPase subunit MlaF
LCESHEPNVNQFMNGKVDGPIPFNYKLSEGQWGLLD